MNNPILHSFAKKIASKKVTNDDLSTLMDTNDDWITQRTGIKTRYWATESETTSSLGTDAARQTIALSSESGPVDCVIAATLSPDFSFPGLGVQLQHALALGPVPSYDIRNQCTGFLYALEMAASLIKTGQYKKILVVGSEVHSTGLDISTRGRDVAVLFGDGAGSCIVEAASQVKTKSKRYEFIASELHSDGAFLKELWCENPGSASHAGRVLPTMLEDTSIFPKMNGRVVFEHAVKRMCESSISILKKSGLSPKDIALIVPHQANLRINSMVAQTLGLKDSQVFNTIQVYGNTTAATIPIGFTDGEAAGAIPSEGYILSAAFGAGFTWGAAVLKIL